MQTSSDMFEKLRLFKIKVSDNIAITFIGLAVLLYLVPSLMARYQFNEMESEYKKEIQQQEERITQQKQSVDNAITSLGLQDDRLAICLRENLKRFTQRPDATLTTDQLLTKVSNLHCPGRGIKTIKGIQGLTRLNTVNLNYNNIEDLSPLKNLPQLSTLKLEANRVNSIKPLFSMPALKRVALPDLSRFNCRDISAQLGMANFKVTNSSYQQIQCKEGTLQSSKNTSRNLRELMKPKRKMTAEESLKEFSKQFEEDDDRSYMDDF